MLEDFSDLSRMQIDALKEISNIGAGNAATALAQMVGSKIDMKVPQINIVPFNDVSDILGGADTHVVGIFLSVSGDAPCSLLFILPVAKACLLSDMLLGGQKNNCTEELFNEMEISAMMELGNILAATYLNALVMFTELSFIPSVPAIGIDMAGAIIDAILAQYGEIGDHVLLLETEFIKDNQEVVGNFFLLPEPGSLNSIMSALGVNNL